MITYVEKGWGLHLAIQAAGHSLVRDAVTGEWTSSDDAAVQAIIDAYDPLAAARLAKWKEIQASRDQRKLAGVVVGGHRFHSDADSRIQQLGLLAMGQNMPPGIQWKTMDGTFVGMTPALAQAIFQAEAAWDMAVFSAAEVHRLAMEASETPETYDYSAGWPGA